MELTGYLQNAVAALRAFARPRAFDGPWRNTPEAFDRISRHSVSYLIAIVLSVLLVDTCALCLPSRADHGASPAASRVPIHSAVANRLP